MENWHYFFIPKKVERSNPLCLYQRSDHLNHHRLSHFNYIIFYTSLFAEQQCFIVSDSDLQALLIFMSTLNAIILDLYFQLIPKLPHFHHGPQQAEQRCEKIPENSSDQKILNNILIKAYLFVYCLIHFQYYNTAQEASSLRRVNPTGPKAVA